VEKIRNIKNRFYDLCKSSLYPSGQIGDPQHCVFCGAEKSTFQNPMSKEFLRGQKVTVVLQCRCERHFEMLDEFVEANREWWENPDAIPQKVPHYGTGQNVLEKRVTQRKFVVEARYYRDQLLDIYHSRAGHAYPKRAKFQN